MTLALKGDKNEFLRSHSNIAWNLKTINDGRHVVQKHREDVFRISDSQNSVERDKKNLHLTLRWHSDLCYEGSCVQQQMLWMLCHSFHWRMLAIRRSCLSAQKGSNNFKQHLLPQLCGCLIQALIIYMLFCNKDNDNKDMKRIIENSVFFTTGSNFPWFYSFMASLAQTLLIGLSKCHIFA